MSHSNSKHKLPSILYFNKVKNNIQFTISGQGCIIYNFADAPIANGYSIVLTSKDKVNKLEIKFTKNNIILNVNDKLLTEQEVTGILTDKGAYYWLSLDTQNLCLRFGIGEARYETQEFYFMFDKSLKIDVLSTLSNIEFSLANYKSLNLLRDSIVGSVPLKVKDTNNLTLYDIAANTALPKANLTAVCQKLYSNISGKNFALNTPDFPDFTEAIEYSISTPGCWAHNKLQEKSNEFGVPNPREVYLRITLGKNGGESPGIPYVMEIWPANCYSPIHNHANANAIIRVLHGQIKVFLYPFLSEIKKINNDPLLAINPDDTYGNKSFASKVFSEGDITWISAVQNQTHQLYNSNIGGPTCITIQCYMYDESDRNHYAFFDYKVEDSNKIDNFDPDSDMDFLLFKEIIKKEWLSK